MKKRFTVSRQGLRRRNDVAPILVALLLLAFFSSSLRLVRRSNLKRRILLTFR